MQKWAIIERRTKRFVSGTDWRFIPPRVMLSDDEAELFGSKDTAKYEMKSRCLGEEFKAVKVKVTVAIDNEKS